MENICSANNYKLIEFVNIIDGILMCFSFIYVTNDLREDAYICSIYAMKRTTESAIYVMELWLWDDFKRLSQYPKYSPPQMEVIYFSSSLRPSTPNNK